MAMALTDVLQWLVMGVAIAGVLGFIGYVLLRILRTLDKADRYFDSKNKESGQPKPTTIYPAGRRIRAHPTSYRF